MARFPVKVKYAIMGAIELAAHFGSNPMQAKLIAQRQGIPHRFIEHILHAMKQAGLLTSHRGAQGGYSLARPPASISLADIVQAVGGIHQEAAAHPAPLNGEWQPRNVMEILLSEIQQQLREAELEILRSISLQALVDRYRQAEAVEALMFHI
ncbi:MAG: Rrf2 family transcriptional regulator [Nitrospirae bacterium]|nr:MAG: Rrf2 family transcriptional regulator [Nitrospirota bacterium]